MSTIETITYAVLTPIGGSRRAVVCSVHTTHLAAHHHLSRGRVVGVVPAGTRTRANVAVTTVQEHARNEVARVLGDRTCAVHVNVAGGASQTTVSVLRDDWLTQGDRDERAARTDALLPLLAALGDGAGRNALVAALRQASV